MESAKFIELLKAKRGLTTDYALATCLGITQPEVNLIRRGQKAPNPEVCIRLASMLDLNPVELLLVAQKDKAPTQVKPYWNMALTAVEVMLKVPKRPRYIPQKVQAIEQELRQLSNQVLSYEGVLAHAEAVRLMESTQRTVDSVMERWKIWREGEPLYPCYLLVNKGAVDRDVVVRRLLIFSRGDVKNSATMADGVQVMSAQRQAGVSVFYAYREELEQSVVFRRLADAYQHHIKAKEINAALFDEEILLVSHSYAQMPLKISGIRKDVTHIQQLQITWKPEYLHELNPLPLFEMPQFVLPFRNARIFRAHVAQWMRVSKSAKMKQPKARSLDLKEACE